MKSALAILVGILAAIGLPILLATPSVAAERRIIGTAEASETQGSIVYKRVIEIDSDKIIVEEEVPVPLLFLAAKLRKESLATGKFLIAVSGPQFRSLADAQDRIHDSGRYNDSSKEQVKRGEMIAPTEHFALTVISTVNSGSTSWNLLDPQSQFRSVSAGSRNLGGVLSSTRNLGSVGSPRTNLGGVLGRTNNNLATVSTTRRQLGSMSSLFRQTMGGKNLGLSFDNAKAEVLVHLVLEPINIENGLEGEAFEGEGKAKISDLGVSLRVGHYSAAYQTGKALTAALVEKATERAVANLVANIIKGS